MTRMSLDGFAQVQQQLVSDDSSRHTQVTEIGPDKSACDRRRRHERPTALGRAVAIAFEKAQAASAR
jgi:hypothetical protein